ncbi:hypothetical protein [Sphingomonas sp.]|uniref:hypothetical protein n=1 Tax=Sphingomonas sp. TaxID=28214 RepID=UPI0031DBF099
MTERFILAAALSAALFAWPAWACSPVPMPPPLPGESQQAYKARIAEEQRRQAERWLRNRQTDALQRADTIFIARETVWPPPSRPQARAHRGGAPRPPARIKSVSFVDPPPAYFKPIDWFRGPRTRASFRIERSMTTCGVMSVGDTSLSTPSNLYVFFARKGPLSEKTLIDAIAADRIDDPALVAFVARHRGMPPAARR